MDKSLTFRSRPEGRTIPCRGKIPPPRKYSGFLLWWSIRESSLDVTTWRRSRYLEATCCSALGGCKQGEPSLRPARKLLPLFRVDDFFALSSIFSFLRVVVETRGGPRSRVRARFAGEFVPAGWPVSLTVRLRRCAAAHGGVMATLSWLWGSPRARSHPHAMWTGDQYLTPAIPAFPPRGRSSVPLRRRTVAPILTSVASLPLVGVVAMTMLVVASNSLVERASLCRLALRCREDGAFRVITGGMVGLTARARLLRSSFSWSFTL